MDGSLQVRLNFRGLIMTSTKYVVVYVVVLVYVYQVILLQVNI